MAPQQTVIRSILSVPAHVSSMANKARRHGADVIAWDLEDAVPQDRKQVALDSVIFEYRTGDAIRLNDEFPTVERLSDTLFGGVTVIVPKAEVDLDLIHLRGLFASCEVWSVIESPRAIRNLDSLCEAADAVIFGAADFRAAAGIAEPGGRLEDHARAEVAMAAAAAGIPCYDSPCEELDSNTMELECFRARSLGYTGKICIHPSQISYCRILGTAHADLAELEILAAMAGRGAVNLNGRMVAEPHYRLARRLLDEL